MTIKDLLVHSSSALKNSSTPTLDAELLLAHVLKKDRSYLISHSEESLTEVQVKHFEELVTQRKNGKPIAYITHEKEFFGHSFYVDERVLIPRPETEEIVEDVIEFAKKNPEVKTIIDLGTGSGAIAITLAHELPDHEIIALEISSEALEVAKTNLQRYPSNNLQFIQSDLLSKLPALSRAEPRDTTYHLPATILANLPYIGTETNRFISEETEQYEPHLALFGGSDGLELYRRTWQQIKEKKLNLQALFMEIGFSQAERMEKEARAAFPEYHFEIKHDLAGLPRTAVLKR
ncbi:MAG: peptide chain release factor N(5)-glutamine methyltransferase [Candidatus Altimarinota bacterium]